ncbi:MAG: hypothetical protein BGO23_12855 [Solirubrobacterales bacterium 67-14]|nr:MAG: hypothetical protein BGO23_12855 [Solirubrobacterales bacterium 67-14]
MNMKRILGIFAALASAFLLIGAPGASAAGKTVTISGRAFVFNHMDTGISNATIKVREFPKLSATTNELGDYSLKVPDDANVTPYIESGGPADLTTRNIDGEVTGTSPDVHWNEIDLQTFHTRGQDIENANFQTPQDIEYKGLKALLKVPSGPDGRPEQCVIVTTSSARDVRGVDFRTYWLNTPHGVEGATSHAFPDIGAPTYFNHNVIPDPNQPYSSKDGGIIWPIVPAGTYRVVTASPDARFASFLATCAPGRVVNANPPWGAYELTGDEKPLAASNVAAGVVSAKAVRKSKTKRVLAVSLKSGEAIDATVTVKAGSKLIKRSPKLAPGTKKLTFAFGAKIKAKRAKVTVKLADASGVSFTTVKKANLPKVIKKKAKKRR